LESSAQPLHRVQASWGEGTSNSGEPGGQGVPATTNDATWTDRFFGASPAQKWAAQGGDFNSTASATANGATLINSQIFYQWSSSQLAADVQNWLGFAQRKQGNLDAAFAAYDKALKLNPRHKAAHEYIGEAYLISGKLPQAEQHLAELQKLCTPIPCEEYKDLRRAVDEYKKNNKK
jgi:tetratricopeptide (TPR) repeat protein